MLTESIEAVYEHGSFRPVSGCYTGLEEGQKVHLIVEPFDKPNDILALAGQVYEGLSDEQIDSIGRHVQRQEKFFSEKPAS